MILPKYDGIGKLTIVLSKAILMSEYGFFQ